MSGRIIDIKDGPIEAWVGETLAFQSRFRKVSDSDLLLDAFPSAVAAATLYNPNGLNVTTDESSGSAVLSDPTLTWPAATPVSVGEYEWVANITVNGNTLKTRFKFRVNAAPPD